MKKNVYRQPKTIKARCFSCISFSTLYIFSFVTILARIILRVILKMVRQLSQSNKAAIQRKSRRKNNERKRFEEPLRYFIEHKYNHIFSEYSQFYAALDRRYPGKRNLTKSEMFKEWLKVHPKASSPPDILSTVITETLGEGFQFVQQDEVEGIESEAIVEDTEANEAVNEANEATEAIVSEVINEADEAIADEAINEAIVDEAINEADEAIGQADAIIQQLLENVDMRRVLNQAEDEGIEMSVFDDHDILPFDIESLDYELEVEGYDW